MPLAAPQESPSPDDVDAPSVQSGFQGHVILDEEAPYHLFYTVSESDITFQLSLKGLAHNRL